MKYLMLILLVGTSSWAFASDCVVKNRLGSHEVTSSTSIVFRSRRHEKYEMTVSRCGWLRHAETIGFRTMSSTWVCAGDELLVYDWNFQIVNRCLIRKIEKLIN